MSMSFRRAGGILRLLLLGSPVWMALLGLAACATGAAAQEERAPQAPAATSPSEAIAPPSATSPPPGATSQPPSVTSPPPSATVTPPAASSGEDKPLPPCIPARPPHPKHRKPKEASVPRTAAPTGPPSPAPADALVDAQVGEVGTSLGSILGRDVTSPKGEDLGRVVDVLADAQGHVRVAIIDFGGFLGVGTRRIAVDWPLLRFDEKSRDKPLMLSVDRQKLQSAPEYNPNKPRVLMPPAAPDAPDADKTKK
jgi:hypothetical protein